MRAFTRILLVVSFGMAACGDNTSPTVLVHDALRLELSPTVALRLFDGEALVWESAFSDARGAMAVGVATEQVESTFGSFRFTDPVDGQRWRRITRLGQIVRVSDVVATFVAYSDELEVAQGRLELLPGEAGPSVKLAIQAPAWGRISVSSTCLVGEHFVGLGGQSFNVDHRGQTVTLWVQEDGIRKADIPDDDYSGLWFFSGRRHSTHTPMPMVLSSRGYAMVANTDARTTMALCSDAPGAARVEVWDRQLELVIFPGRGASQQPVGPRGAIRDALHGMLTWVGKPALPPAAVFAPWVDAVFGEANVLRVAEALRANGIAASAIWTEDFRGAAPGPGGYELDEDWRIDRRLYPNFEAVAARLHDAGFLFLTYANTFLDAHSDIYNEAITRGFAIADAQGAPYQFTGVKLRPSSLLDLTNPAAVAWAKDVLREMLDAGADGWMADFGEWLPVDARLASGREGRLAHNAYPRELAQATHALLTEPGARPRLWFSRAAWLHAQRYIQVLWAGDQQTDFNANDGMASVIPMGLGLGVTGFPYFSHDIAGYVSMGDGVAPTDRELFFRWVTFGALTPVMRTHHGRDAHANFQWASTPEATAHFRRWTRFHMQLAPYLMGLAHAYQATSLPLFRLLAFDFPNEPWAWSQRDQYLLGDRLLVAPVLTRGAVGREVRLPSGTWYSLWGGSAIVGTGDPMFTPVAVTELPVFVPAGSLLVLYPDGVDTVLDAPALPGALTSAKLGARREVWLWPGQAQESTLQGWSETAGPSEAAAAAWFWSGRERSAVRPTTATWRGAPVVVTQQGDDAVVTLIGDGGLVFAGGGTLTVKRGLPAAETVVRLRGTVTGDRS